MGFNTSGQITSRRADLDSLRVLALLLLIVYHSMLIYSPREEWRVTSLHAGQWADYLISALSPWRMSLVFFVGGCAARFMIERAAFAEFIKERATKLLTAFVVAVILFVPLQRYVRLDDMGLLQPDYLTYLLTGAPFVVDYHGVRIPEVAHAWFLPYLFAYSVAAVVTWRYAPNLFRRLQTIVEGAPFILWLALTMAWFALIEAFLLPIQPMSGLFPTDITAHAKFFPVFFLGVLVGKSGVFRGSIASARGWLWLLAPALLVSAELQQWVALQADPRLVHPGAALLLSRGLYGGAMVFAVAAFGDWALNKPSPLLTYVTDAILPVYLMHQSALVVAADAITPWELPLPVELLLLFSATALLPLALYHLLIRRNSWLRVMFGLRPALKNGDEQAIARPNPA